MPYKSKAKKKHYMKEYRKRVKLEWANSLRHRCFKCGKLFVTKVPLDTDKPTCDYCFKQLLKIDNASDYYKFIN